MILNRRYEKLTETLLRRVTSRVGRGVRFQIATEVASREIETQIRLGLMWELNRW